MSNNNNSASRGSMDPIDSRSLSSGKKTILFLVIVFAGLILFYIQSGKQPAPQKQEEETQRAINFPAHNANLDLADPPALNEPPPPPEEKETITVSDFTNERPSLFVEAEQADPVIERKMKSGFSKLSISASSMTTQSSTTSTSTENGSIQTNKQQSLNYDGQGVARVSASRIPNRSLIITQGAKIQCTLETALDSTVPGMTSCIIGEDVYSADGKVRLIDRGSKLNGRYESDLKQGKARIAILWERLETPEGVLVNLSSPSTDVLGRSGADGYIDKHFWDRFSNAIMLSLISDAFQYANSRKSGRESPLSDTEESAQEMAQTTLEHEIDISPTLHKNHGEPIMVFLNKDLSFEQVYTLSLEPPKINTPDFEKRFRESQYK